MHSGKGIDLTKLLETTVEDEKADVPIHTQKKFKQVILKLINQGPPLSETLLLCNTQE